MLNTVPPLSLLVAFQPHHFSSSCLSPSGLHFLFSPPSLSFAFLSFIVFPTYFINSFSNTPLFLFFLSSNFSLFISQSFISCLFFAQFFVLYHSFISSLFCLFLFFIGKYFFISSFFVAPVFLLSFSVLMNF